MAWHEENLPTWSVLDTERESNMGVLADKIKSLSKKAKTRKNEGDGRGVVDWEALVVESDEDGDIVVHSEDDLDNQSLNEIEVEDEDDDNEDLDDVEDIEIESEEDLDNEFSKDAEESRRYGNQKSDEKKNKKPKRDDFVSGTLNMMKKTPASSDSDNRKSSRERESSASGNRGSDMLAAGNRKYDGVDNRKKLAEMLRKKNGGR